MHQMPAESNCSAPIKISGKAGKLIVFDSNQTHLHGANISDKLRRVLIVESQTFNEIYYGYNSQLKNKLHSHFNHTN